MDWRCEWCGKPHEENDPPCDNCGHGSFEEAVVRQTDLSTDGPESTRLWVCTECGREHTKHSPPCSRCGAATLELQEKGVDESELTAPGYLDLLTPTYAVGLVVVLGLVVLFVAGATGLADVPGFPGDDVPEVTDPPGDPTSYGTVALADVESAYVEGYNDLRAERGTGRLERTSGLDEIATYYNQRRVQTDYAGGTLPSDDELVTLLRENCRSQPVLLPLSHTADGGGDADALAEALLSEQVVPNERGLDRDGERTGVDVHATPDDRLYVTQVIC